VEDPLDPLQQGLDNRSIADIAFDQGDPAGEIGQVFPAPGRKIIEHPDPMASIGQAPDQVGTDKTRAACNQDIHRSSVIAQRNGR